MRFRRVLSQAGQGLGRNLTMTIAGVLTVMIALLLLGAGLVIRGATNQIRDELVNQLNVSVFLNPNVTESQLQSNGQTLRGLQQVASVNYINQDEAYNLFKKQNQGNTALLEATSRNIIPPSYVVKLHDPRKFSVIYSAMGCAPGKGCSTPGVQAVTNANSVFKKVFRFLHGLTVGALLLALLSLLATALLIYNTMQVSAFTRRRETGIMRLVGAGDLSIQAPFVLEGAIIGLIGSLLAFGLLMLGRLWVHSNVKTSILAPFGEWGRYVGTLPWVLVVGIGLSAILSFVTLQRHLRV